MSGLDLNDFDDDAVIKAISVKTERLRQLADDAMAQANTIVGEYREWIEGLQAIGVDSGGELKPSEGADPPPPSEPAPSPTPSAAPPSRNRPASMADKQRQVDAVVETARKLGPRQMRSAIQQESGLSEYQAKAAIGEAARVGRIEVTGKGAGTRYSVPESRKPVTEGPPADRGAKAGGDQEPTTQGRILAALQTGEATASGLGISLGLPLNEITPALGHLVHDGDVAMAKGGKYRLAA